MPGQLAAWIQTHHKQAAAGGAVAGVAAIALYARHRKTAAASASDPTVATTTGSSVYGVGGQTMPGVTTADLQNAVQSQINDEINGARSEMAAEIARIPAGKTGPAGPAGKPAPARPPARPVPTKRTPPAPRPQPRSQPVNYTVRPGDSLSAIASKYGMSLAALEARNSQFSSNYNLIYPGQEVHIR